MALFKHDTHYGLWSGFPYYNLTTPSWRWLPVSATQRQAEQICGCEPWEPSPVPSLRYRRSCMYTLEWRRERNTIKKKYSWFHIYRRTKSTLSQISIPPSPCLFKWSLSDDKHVEKISEHSCIDQILWSTIPVFNPESIMKNMLKRTIIKV